MKNISTLISGLMLLSFTLFYSSCDPDNNIDCNNLNVIQDTYTGNIDVNSGGEDPSADFVGSNDSGIYIFEWCNPMKRASLDFDITTTSGGSVQIVLKDHEGDIVLDKTRPGGGDDSFSGVSAKGVSGTWTVEVTLININGDGSWSMHPGD